MNTCYRNRIFSIATRILVLILFLLFSSYSTYAEDDKRTVLVVSVNSTINPITSEYIHKNIQKAHENNLEAVIIELDTPGGLDTSMRSIVKDIIGSSIPVVVYVSPSGSRAASAGVFITLAAHIAAMAPGTNIGAAHPVGIGEKMDKTTVEKATNDAAAYIKSLAEKRGRNGQWAENAVRKSISSTESQALDKGVIDIVADNIDELLLKINGKTIETTTGEKILQTKDAVIIRKEFGLRDKILNFISDPNVAYILMLLGFYGLFFELTNPGSMFPGILGGIFLILAFYSFQTLPVNYAGVLLIILGIILFILEVKIVSHGLLSIGGIISLVIGSLMLFKTSAPFMQLSISVIIPAVLIMSLFFIVTIRLAVKAYRRKPVTGNEGLIGMEGVANTDLSPEGGMISLHGELWAAFSDETISKGTKIVVESVSGLKLKVKMFQKQMFNT